MKEPIMEFKNQEELNACLEEWRVRLFLQDWTIRAELLDRKDMEIQDACGENLINQTSKASMIHIARDVPYPHDPTQIVQKMPHELTLVHELLHCKYTYLEDDENSIESVTYFLHEHILLEQMAKSLIMAKYGIDFDWFRCF